MTSTVAHRERAALADLLDQVGPDQNTLCDGWDTGDLLVHLLIRERRPDTIPGLFIPLFKGWTKKIQDEYRSLPWKEQVDMFRQGPPHFSPIRIEAVDSAMNTGEYFIHHEDVRRGVPGWKPRKLDTETTEALEKQILGFVGKLSAKQQVGKSGVGVKIALPDRPEAVLVAGNPSLTLVGAPGEVVLWTSGRRACEVEVTGAPEALAVLDKTTRR